MTSSNTLKKLVSIGAAMLLAVGGSLTSATPASAAAATTAPVVSSPALVGNTVSATPAVWPSGTATGKWYVCDSFGSAAAATSVPSGCDALYTSSSNTASITASTLTIPSISYCVTICTSFGNSSTAFKLRWIEVNGSDISASAAVAIQEGRSLTLQTPNIGSTFVTLGVSNGCTFSSSSLSSFADFTLLVGGSARTISSVTTTSGNIDLNFSGALTSGQTISVSYTQSSDPVISCGASAFVINTTSALTRTVGGGGGGSLNTISTPASYSISNNVATAYDGVWSGGTTTRYWIICDNPHNSPSTSIHMDCYPMALTQNGSDERGTTVTLAADVWMGFSGSRTQVSFASKYFGLYVQNGGAQYVTATTAGPAVAASVAAPLRALDALRALKPLPTAVQPLVAALPILSKPMASTGGKLNVAEGDFTGLVSAKIANKSIDFILGKTGQITMTVPQGEAGKTADLVLTFNTGSIILQDAIKYVAPVVVANVPARPISISSSSKTFSEEAQSEIRQAAFANVKNTAVACVGYAAANTASARDAAVALATKACAIATKANSDLAMTGVNVVVDKLKARTQGVGIKVYKADN